MIDPAGAVTEYRIRPARPADAAGVLSLIDEAHGPGEGWDRTLDFLRWKHEDNPFGPTLMLLAEENHQLLGIKALMRWRLSTPRGPILLGRAVDAATSAAARRRGIFSNLTRAAIERAEADGYAAIWQTPNEACFRANLKLGATSVGRVRQLVLPLRPLAMLNARIKRRDAHRVPWELTVGRLHTVAEALEDEAAVGRLIEAERAREPRLLRTRHSVEWLRWRYAQVPSPSYFAAWHGESPERALAIVSLGRRRGLREVMVTELFSGDDPRVARSVLRGMGRALGADYMLAAAPRGSFNAGLLHGAGFLGLPERSCLRLTARPLAWPTNAPDITALDSWYLSLGDIELL